MKKIMLKRKTIMHVSLGLSIAAMVFSSCNKLFDNLPGKNHPSKDLGNFKQVNLVASNESYNAARVDPTLLNPWGLAFSSSGTPWIGSAAAGVSQVYDREGKEVLPPVKIPSPGGPSGGTPTGVVTNSSTTDFMLSNGQAARFIFVNLDGVVSGWNGAAGGAALVIKNNVGKAGYTGAALTKDSGQNFLYLVNALKGSIDVLDAAFNQVSAKPFLDPNLPAGYVPFNIHVIGEELFVAYTKTGADGRALNQTGNGVVNVFSTGGKLLRRFADGGKLNAPWGIAIAPAKFFPGSDAQQAILVGNFRDGKINAYKPDGKFIDQLKVNDKILVISGLWEISFPPSTSTIDPNRLYFAAGVGDEKDGLFGYIIQ